MFTVLRSIKCALIKKQNANVYFHSLWENSKRFHCSFEWHLTPHMTLSIETCIRRTPCISFCLYRACFTHLISSNWSCNLFLWYYVQLVHFDKQINANVYRQSLGVFLTFPLFIPMTFDISYDVIYRNL